MRAAKKLRRGAMLGTLLLAAAGCSSYSVRSEAVHPSAAPRPAKPLRAAVTVPEITEAVVVELGPVVTGILQALYQDLVLTLEQSALYAGVERLPLTLPDNSTPAPADVVITVTYRPTLPSGDEHRRQRRLALFSRYRLAPFLEAHETFTVTAELSVVGSRNARAPRRYVGIGTALLTSKVYAPRDDAIRDALIAAGRSANARVIAEIARE